VAKSVVTGVIEGATEIGGNLGGTAKAAVGGAIEAAGSLGQNAVKSISDILVGAVEGVKEVACAVMPKAKTPEESTPAAKEPPAAGKKSPGA
jgi:hypothetical protein